MSSESPDDLLNELPETEWSVLEEMGTKDAETPDWESSYSMAVVDFFRALGSCEEEALCEARNFFDQLFTGQIDEVEELTGAFRVMMKKLLERFSNTGDGNQRLHEASRQFDRAWGMSLMQKAVDALRAEMEKANEERLFALLSPILDGRPLAVSRQELAAQLELPLEELNTTIISNESALSLFSGRRDSSERHLLRRVGGRDGPLASCLELE